MLRLIYFREILDKALLSKKVTNFDHKAVNSFVNNSANAAVFKNVDVYW